MSKSLLSLITYNQKIAFIEWFNINIKPLNKKSFAMLVYGGVAVYCNGNHHTKCLEYLETIECEYSYDLNYYRYYNFSITQ